MSRPQISIHRLPVRRPSNESREAMNCKSCRKRKIKCNRIKPSCEACQVFNCACIYDAIPKKRGPKTDVLEALLKRVNGLEKRLKDEKKEGSPEDADAFSSSQSGQSSGDSDKVEPQVQDAAEQRSRPEDQHPILTKVQSAPAAMRREKSGADSQGQDHTVLTDALLDTYFARLHGKPYYVLDEPATRQRYRDGGLPHFLSNAIHAVSVRYASHLCGGHNVAVRSSQEHILRSRGQIDVGEPTIDHLRALLLLAMASFQSGKGRKSYMLLSHAIAMAFALSLHRELPPQLRIVPSERENRRRLFWTCYVMDRFTACGSKRPSSISDDTIYLRLPAWQPGGSQMLVDGEYFPTASSLPYGAGVASAGEGSGAMLVGIVRVLGVTNRYLAAGGVKGDSHFPWHAQSSLSKIRSDLDYWAAKTQDAFTSLETLFGKPDSTTLVLSKLIYHLIHCLIYRPFLPVDLAELSGASQHQSWQIEATNLCFLHANAIAELVEIGKNTSIIDWPSFVGFCICTAGTVHVHGAHYMSIQDGDVFRNSAEFLSREMAQLAELRLIWTGVQHQRETLQIVYASHSNLVKSLANSPMRYSPVFQVEDFYDRYPGSYIDGAHVTFADVELDAPHESLPAYSGLTSSAEMCTGQFQPSRKSALPPTTPSQSLNQNPTLSVVRKPKRRRTTHACMPYPTPVPDQSLQGSLERRSSNETHVVPPQARHEPIQYGGPQNNNHRQAHTFTQSTFSPSFNFSPIPENLGIQLTNGTNGGLMETEDGRYDPFYGAQGTDYQTPRGMSARTDSPHSDLEKDPFLSLLEQLAENDNGANGGPSNLDYFLNEHG